MKPRISNEEIISIINDMHIKNPLNKIKQTDVSRELEKRGVILTKSSLCKNKEVAGYIKKVNEQSIDIKDIRVLSFVPLDMAKLRSASKERLFEVIQERESYYKGCVELATDARSKAMILSKKAENTLHEKEKSEKKETAELKKEIKRLKDIIKDKILPSMAAQLLNENQLESNLIRPIEPINGDTVFENDVLNDIMKGVE